MTILTKGGVLADAYSKAKGNYSAPEAISDNSRQCKPHQV